MTNVRVKQTALSADTDINPAFVDNRSSGCHSTKVIAKHLTESSVLIHFYPVKIAALCGKIHIVIVIRHRSTNISLKPCQLVQHDTG